MLKKLGNNPYFNALRNIRALLDLDQKKRGAIMVLLLLLNAGFDVLGLTSIFPLIDAAINPTTIQEKWYLSYPYKWIGVDDTITFLFLFSLFILLIFLIKNVLSIIIFYLQSRYSFNVSLRLSKKMFQYYYNQGFLYIKDEESGKKAYSILNIPYYFAATYLLQTFILTTEIVVLLIVFFGLLLFEPAAILVLITVIVPTFLLVYLFTKNRVKAIGDQRNVLYPQAYSTIIESMAAYADVKLANKEQYFFDKYSNLLKSINKLDAQQQGIYNKIPQRMNDVVLGMGITVVFAFALIFQESSKEIISILSVFGLAAYRFLPSVNRIMGAILNIKNANYVVTELKSVSNKKIHNYKNITPLNIQKKVSFKNISYKYPGTDARILKNISFSVAKGETIGFIGTSGSGKTTLLNLLLRFLKETEGNIFVDNVTLNDINKASFQKCIGFVQQDVFIRMGSLEENIAFGEEQINREKVISVLKSVNLFHFVNEQPDGLKMQLGENGVKLSGGQKQRVGIARALYKDAEILVFDEATSALDMDTESTIINTINDLTNLNKIIFIVAHRITTLEKCNRIYEMENGAIVKKFSYSELFEEKFSNKTL